MEEIDVLKINDDDDGSGSKTTDALPFVSGSLLRCKWAASPSGGYGVE